MRRFLAKCDASCTQLSSRRRSFRLAVLAQIEIQQQEGNMNEKELYVRKMTSLKRALKRAEELDAEDAHGAKLRPWYELEPGQELKDD
jgi:hypothetical protein